MFGYASAFVNGNMFRRTFKDSIVVRLAEVDRAALLKLKGGRSFEPMPGRPMKEYAVVPPSIVAKPKELGRGSNVTHRYGLTAAPKARRRQTAREEDGRHEAGTEEAATRKR